LREVTTNRGKLLLKESIKELTIGHYTEFTKYIVQESGIGSDMVSVNKHFNALDTFLANGKIDEARAERYNLHFNIVLALNKINITHMSFALFVYSIDGEEVKDYSESGLERICKRLAEVELGRGELETILSEIKKKLMTN
jgi:hypothetical protein